MHAESELKKTMLHRWHVEHNGNMAEFGGYHMPLWYDTGTKGEHLSVINGAGLFDTSHMAVVIVSGEGSFELLQACFSKDLEHCIGRIPGKIVPGRSVYGLFLNDDGTVLDDAIVSLLISGQYMVVVNSGMGALIAARLKKYAGSGVTITDLTDRIGKIDIQGPDSACVLEKLFDEPDPIFADMVYFSFKGDIFSKNPEAVATKDGIPVLVSRTGYTGEFGFEIFSSSEHVVQLWETLLDAGSPYNLTACGLAARDSLRAGAMLPLSHQDIGDWVFAVNPWSFVLPWNDDRTAFTKPFVGAEAVLDGRESSYTYGFAGFDPRKITVTEQTVVLNQDMKEIGSVLTCTTDMATGRGEDRIFSVATPESAGKPPAFRARGLSCGFIKTNCSCKTGENVFLSEGKRKLEVEIREDVRPDRTARYPMKQMRNRKLK